jgi:hypothetical protein
VSAAYEVLQDRGLFLLICAGMLLGALMVAFPAIPGEAR